MDQLATYVTYYSKEEAKELTGLLDSVGIPYKVEQNKDLLDKIYIGDSLDPTIAIKISPNHFEQVNELLRLQAKNDSNNIHPDYYLFNFSNDELIDVVRNKDEWNAFDQGLAEKILSDRKVGFDAVATESESAVTYTPSKVTGLMLVLEYIIAIVVPYSGVLIGLATIAAFRTLHTGRRVKIYNEATRTHGIIMIAIGIART